MRKIVTPVILAAAMLIAAGCNTSEVFMQPAVPGQTGSDGTKAVANLEASNWGLFLFYWIPLWSGNPSFPNRRDYAMFDNRVQERFMEKMLRTRAQQLKADRIEDLKIRESSTGFFSLWILWRRSMRATAVAVGKADSSGGGEEKTE